MKLFFVTLIIYAVVNLGTYSAGQGNPRLIVTRISDSNDDIVRLIKELGDSRELVNNKIKAMDFGIFSNTQVINLQKELDDRRLKRTINDCVSLFNNTINKLNTELIASSEKDADKRFTYMINEANGFLGELKIMLANVEGEKLDHEVEACKVNPTGCLIAKYSTRITEINAVSRNDRWLIQSMPFDIYVAVIRPLLNKQITTEIFNPVSECIKRRLDHD
ncbi:PREDICTED: uncharacterized protein LOC105365879 [Ceratosolen solmsi marchali]|uniref:Uncharacterized protein LOC105365879 n=1 Tax=Ceratosolen solmsi marchali TaxID=326594 RepID=A0AAJ6YQP3_9HYME|nr:PREDICTED: uncharacterized protein LOC105365879 [Ceratosolen solmsi marchali]